MDNDLKSYLLEAAQSNQNDLLCDNPYKDVGFDQGKPRLGWVRPVSLSKIEESLQQIYPSIKDKSSFIFIGMGGSINGIKSLLAVIGQNNFYTLDNLDPKALTEILDKIKDISKTLVMPISKSGTTKETQFLALTLKEIFSNRLGADKWQSSFLWLSDPTSFEKLDAFGWTGVKKVPIQFDEDTDIGGRFSAPHTLIFSLPLFLLLNNDLDKLKGIYSQFISLQPEIITKAYEHSQKYAQKANAYFSPQINASWVESFSPWIIQLFQESLGSKEKDLEVRTLLNSKDVSGFLSLDLEMDISNEVVLLMSQMCFFQIFLAFYSAQRKINFVAQDFVEKYKAQMRKLESDPERKEESIESVKLEQLIDNVRQRIIPSQRFIEVVLYFYPTVSLKETIKAAFGQAFNQKITLIFIGSDWNHQAYQAAFNSKDTFYVLLTASCYEMSLLDVSSESLSRNVSALRLVAAATYLTIKDKALLFAYSLSEKKV